MKVSIIIPTFNEEKYIGDCLLSLIKQIEEADEIIVVDNNSQDKTLEIVDKFPVKVITESKQGISHPRNRGFDNAKHDIIVRCDADTRPPSGWIKKIKDFFLINKEVEALVGPLIFYDLPLKTTLYSKTFYSIFRLIAGFDLLIGPNMALKKNIWNKIRKNVCTDDLIIHEDIDLAIHINKAHGKIFYDPSLINFVSGRRIKNNPYSFFVEYPIKLYKTLTKHRKL